jgi:RNA polymerase sigma-70 factor (ECF subfamily)
MMGWMKRARLAVSEAPSESASGDPAPRLMERYCAGEADAFRALYALLAPMVLAELAGRGCGGPPAVRVLEAAFLTLHRDRGLYVVGADPRPWLLALARRHELALARQVAAHAVAQPQGVSA